MGTLDVFVLSHFFGWLVKALIFRNSIITWTMSIGFEIYELSLKHILPNFHECWWDHLLLDLFGCNLIGIIIGNYIIKKFKIKRHHWFFEPTEETEKMTYFQRFKFFFTNVGDYVKNGKWHLLSSGYNFIFVLWILIATSICDLSNFFNKTALNIPANHFLLKYRIFILGFFSIIVNTDFYAYSRDQSDLKKVPLSIKIFHFIIFSELILFLKNYNPVLFQRSAP